MCLRNNYVNELSANGMYNLFAAFKNNQIYYKTFYASLDDQEVFKNLKVLLEEKNNSFAKDDIFDITREIRHSGKEKRLNIAVIVVESLSAEYLGAFGNHRGLTPNLDRLAEESLFFTNLHATGTRTDRGLEAISLSVPPTPGRSIVKRPDNKNMFSWGFLMKERGYDVKFIYSGYGYFDNMNNFFSHNGFETIDRKNFSKNEVIFENAWGVCDIEGKEMSPSKGSVTEPKQPFRFWHIWFPGILFLSWVLIFEFTDLDLWCSDIFYDFGKGRFFWRDAWWANQLLHTGGRYAIASVVIASLILLVWSFLMRNNRWINWQRALIFLILSIAMGSGITGLLKATTNRHYPTHIERYGGNVPYRKLFQAQPSGFKRSKGYPAAHASGGYSLMAFYFIFYKRNKLRAYLGLALGLAVGTLFAFGQQVRGVHFASHNICSAAICWYGSLLLYYYPFRQKVSGPLFKPI